MEIQFLSIIPSGRKKIHSNIINYFLYLSGPRDCLCSEKFACTANGSNDVDTIFGVMKVKGFIKINNHILIHEGGRLPNYVSGTFRL